MGDVGEIEVGRKVRATITYHRNKRRRKVMKCLYIAGGMPYDFYDWVTDFWFVEESNYWGKVKWV